MRTLMMLLAIASVFPASSFAGGRLGLYYFCYCKEAGKGFEPRQARVIYNELSNGADVDQHRVGDAAFYQTGPNQYHLIPIDDSSTAGKTPVSYETKQPCLDIFFGNEAKVCDGDVRTGTVGDDET